MILYQVFPQDTDINEVLKFYTRVSNHKCYEDSRREFTFNFSLKLCSVEVDCQRGAVMAATLANSGYCPITGKRVRHIIVCVNAANG